MNSYFIYVSNGYFYMKTKSYLPELWHCAPLWYFKNDDFAVRMKINIIIIIILSYHAIDELQCEKYFLSNKAIELHVETD